MITYFFSGSAEGDDSGDDWDNAITSITALTGKLAFADDDVIVFMDDGFYSGNIILSISHQVTIIGGYSYDFSIGTYGSTSSYMTRLSLGSCTNTSPVKFSNVEFFNSITNNDVMELVNVEFDSNDCIINNGTLLINGVNAYGLGVFLNNHSEIESINRLTISGFTKGILSDSNIKNINNSVISNCLNGVEISMADSDININNSLIYNSFIGVLTNTSVNFNQSTVLCVTPSSSVSYTNLDSVLDDNYDAYSFADPLHGDFSPLIGADNSDSSILINGGSSSTPDQTVVDFSTNGFIVKFNNINIDSIPFVFKRGETIVFSNYGRDVSLARRIDDYLTDPTYAFSYTKQVILHNILVKHSFDKRVDQNDAWPYEWDMIDITTPVIEDTKFIVPRSIIDLGDILNSVGIRDTDIKENSIKVYNNMRYGGISYDYKASNVGSTIIWYIEKNNNILVRKNLISGEEERFPLMCPDLTDPLNKLTIRPSGLIPLSRTKDGFNFTLENDTTITVKALNEVGDFYWICTDINNSFEPRGLLVHKDSTWIVSVYTINDTSTPILLRYNNRDTYKHYIGNEYDVFNLSSDNSSPTDMTVYEDGTLYIADLNSKIFKYKPLYDYALKEDAYNNKTKLVLREQYDDVTSSITGE